MERQPGTMLLATLQDNFEDDYSDYGLYGAGVDYPDELQSLALELEQIYESNGRFQDMYMPVMLTMSKLCPNTIFGGDDIVASFRVELDESGNDMDEIDTILQNTYTRICGNIPVGNALPKVSEQVEEINPGQFEHEYEATQEKTDYTPWIIGGVAVFVLAMIIKANYK